MDANAPVRTLLQPYLPRLTLEWLASDPAARHRAVDGSVVFVDISGFTKLSEKLAKFGRIGGEEMADAINRCFAELLAVAYEGDGSLLKFGGDALLLLFTGGDTADHAVRAARAAAGMRQRLRTVGKLQTTGGRVNLRMSVGVHQGRFDFFLVGDSHRELLVAGPGATEVVTMEGTADAGEIVISPSIAACLPPRCVGEPKGPGFFLRSAPRADEISQVWVLPEVPDDLLRGSVSVATREHLLAGASEPEHRQAAVAFIHFDGTDHLLESEGPEAVAEELDLLVRDAQEAVDEFGVCFLASDVDADGGKLILTAGVPRAMGEDEERMLLALRRIADARTRKLPIKLGVNQGPVFSGDVGPSYRRTYTVMGDTVNLAARLMAKAPHGQIYASGSVLDRSATRFELEELEPFMVKGKAKPINAWALGEPIGSRSREAAGGVHALVGREDEVEILRAALDRARAGRGSLVVIEGEPGIGKSRLLSEMWEDASDLVRLHATCEAYTSTTPYSVWRELLRELLGLGWEEHDDVVLERLWGSLSRDEDLLPWLPLVAIPLDVDIPPTLEIENLAPEFRRAKLHEVVERFLELELDTGALIEIEDAHLMDPASADLLAALAGGAGSHHWAVAVARRDADTGFQAPDADAVVPLKLAPLSEEAVSALARAASHETPLLPHDLNLVVERSAGNPQFVLDLVRAAATGSMLPDSVEAAATARIDQLSRDDRTLVRRASVLGLAFHPRYLNDVVDERTPLPDEGTWRRLSEFFEDDGDGYVRFRRAVIRDAAYAGLPFRTRRAIHDRVGERLELEAEDPNEAGGILSLHFHLAGIHEKAWPYARSAAARAAEQFAHQEAAQLYQRAIDSGRRLPDVGNDEIAAAFERMGDAFEAAGEFGKAGEAYGASRRLVPDDRLWEARLLYKRSRLEEQLGQYPNALRWATRARKSLEGLSSPDAARQNALLTGWYATVLQAEGRTKAAIRVGEDAVRQSEEAGDLEALGRAYLSLGWSYGVLGRSEAREYWERSLDVYRDLGDLVKQADLLSNLGTLAQWEGRWDDAMENWAKGRDQSLTIGDIVGAAASNDNIAELLTDRGEFDRAERILLESLPLWRASEYRYFLANCLGMLGRLLSRSGRFEEGLERLEEARSHFEHVGAEQELLDVETRLAEARALMGDTADALKLVTAALERAAQSDDEGGMVMPALERVRGYVLFQLGDRAGAEEAWAASLAAARERKNRFEVMLTSLGPIRVALREGQAPDAAAMREVDETLEDLQIRAVPAVPLVAPKG